MDAAQWTTTDRQGLGVVVKDSSTTTSLQLLQGDNNNYNKRVIRPNCKEQALNCPRCNSSNTKFCYYNNYSLTQPRYFCKTCRRYWTEGGSLRNVPVGGGSRKNKRASSSSSASSAAPPTFPSPASHVSLPSIPLPSSDFYDRGGQDLNLCFAKIQPLAHYGFAPAAPESCPGFGAGFGFQELMRPPSIMKLPLGAHAGASMQEGGLTGRLLFPFEDLRQVQMSNINGGREDPQNGVAQQAHDPSLFW